MDNIENSELDSEKEIDIPETVTNRLISDADIPRASDKLSSDLSADQVKEISQDMADEEKYGDQSVKAGTLGAARGASFGMSDQFLTSPKVGKFFTGKEKPIVEENTLRQLKDKNEEASLVGEVAGVVLPSLIPGGAAIGAGVKGAAAVGKGAELATAKSLAHIANLVGDKKTLATIIAKGLPKVAGSAVEGSFYGAGQLISEDALGTNELNAENLLASVGTGAILGGAAGGVFGTLEAIVPIVKKSGEVIASKGKGYADGPSNALDLIGMKTSDKIKIRKTNPTFVEDLPEFLVREAKMKNWQSDKKLFEAMSEVKEDAGTRIGEILDSIDAIGQKAPDILPKKSEVYSKAIQTIDNAIAEKKLKIDLGKVKAFRKELNRLAKADTGRFTPKELNAFRQELDDKINYKVLDSDQSEFNAIAKQVRKGLRDDIDAMADRASTRANLADEQNLLTQLKAENKRFSMATTALPYMEGKVDKNKMFSLMDIVKGGALIGAAGEVGGAVAAGLKLADSDLARRYNIIRYVEKNNQKVEKEIKTAVKNSFKLPKQVAVPTSVNVLLNTAYGRKDLDGKKPENKKEAFKNLSDNLIKLKADPDFLAKKTVINTLRVAKHAPGTAAAVNTTMMKSIEFLESKMPKDPRQIGAFDFTRAKWEPSSTQLAKFERYVEAVEHPLNVLKDIQSGSVSREQVETLSAVYPDLYARVQTEIMDQVTESKEPISYAKRLQLGLLLDIPTDPSLNGSAIAQLQKTFVPKEDQAQGATNAPKMEKLKGPDLATDIEKTQNRNKA